MLIIGGSGVEHLRKRLSESTTIAVDTEYSGRPLPGKKVVNDHTAKLVGISVAFPQGDTFYVPANGERLPEVARLLQDYAGIVWMWNAKADLRVLSNSTRVDQSETFPGVRDGMIAAWLLGSEAPGKSKYGLKAQAKHILGHTQQSFEEMLAQVGYKGADIDDLPPELVAPYAEDDARQTLRLGIHYEPLVKRAGLLDLFTGLEMPLMRTILKMENAGMGIDTLRLRKLGHQLEGLQQEVLVEWNTYFPGVSISSAQQLVREFFDKGMWPVIERTPGGQPSTNTFSLEAIKDHADTSDLGKLAAELKLEYQEVAKILSTYTWSLTEQLQHYLDRRLHGQFLQTGTRTGRLSSASPNLQNIPVRSDYGKEVRRCFVPAEGYTLVSADYSQIELRVLAHYSRFGKLLDAYQQGADIHQQTADLVGCSRTQAKTVNFATVYGAAGKKLAKTLGVDYDTAQKFLDNYHDAYPEVNRFKARAVAFARKHGYTKTIHGHRRLLPGIYTEDKLEKWKAERLAVNTPIQGTAAGIVKKAMLAVDELCDKWGARMICQVHDEIVCEVPEDVAKDFAGGLQFAMESVEELRVPLVAEPSIGTDWGALK